jgi:hypothetical protein
MHHELLLVDTGNTFAREHCRVALFFVPVVAVSTTPVSHDRTGQLGHVSDNPLFDVAGWYVRLN